MCVWHYQLHTCSEQVVYKITWCRDQVAALRGDPNRTCSNRLVRTDRNAPGMCWVCIGANRTDLQTIVAPFNILLDPPERMEHAFEEGDMDIGLRRFYGTIQDVERMVQAHPADGYNSLPAMDTPQSYIDRRRLYSVVEDQWIWARLHTFAAANNGLRIPLPQLLDELNRTFTHSNRSLRSLETHIFRVAMLLRARNQFRAY